MSDTAIQPDAVTVTVTTVASPEVAFEVFTSGMHSWWNPEHHVLPGPITGMGVDPFVGGRVWDENEAGEVCVFGRVLRWEPGRCFAFSWLVGPDFAIPAADARGSRVTVTFSPTDKGTRVDLVHDQFEAHGPGWEGLPAAVGSEGGWPSGLQRFAAAADSAA